MPALPHEQRSHGAPPSFLEVACLLTLVYKAEGALLWMNAPNPELGGATPKSLMRTGAGRERVAEVLDRLASGSFG